MADYEFDFAEGDATDGIDTQWKSKSLCTPGCITGILQTCAIQSFTCEVHVSR
ncbi:gallidermin/nisin family lantibiotic [Corynebacterium freiburgense]|uniref:gallidermin/nisin family lantibiotic n=1 Tax=Corynebacterium freiburgense TaxID=556548 RepID=UPI00041FCB0E|nr:gallidermin/nisin family lantibiotic [Corynebacterium freiburgense]WJZ01864.1 Lantibiotic subtilin precursor [Corynebacterium freiburgense]